VLKNAKQIPTAVTTNGRPLTSNGAGKSGWRRDLERELRDKNAEKESLESKEWRMREWRFCEQSESAVCKRKY